jgi:hypothetical protein
MDPKQSSRRSDTPVRGNRIATRSMQPLGPFVDVIRPLFGYRGPALRGFRSRGSQWPKHAQSFLTTDRPGNFANQAADDILSMRQPRATFPYRPSERTYLRALETLDGPVCRPCTKYRSSIKSLDMKTPELQSRWTIKPPSTSVKAIIS